MNKSLITDIFFDLDHTLWDFDANSALAFGEVLKVYNIPVHLDDFLYIYKPINTVYWENYSYNRISAEELKTGRLRDTFQHFSISFDEKELARIADSYIDELTQHNLLFEDAIPTLKYLDTKYRMHIITNGFSEEQYIKIQRSGLSDFFKTVTTSDDAGVKKPNPEIFYKALHKAQAQPQKAVMIGDNLDADILGAKNVGMNVIHYDYHNQQIPENFKQIQSLSELKKIF